MKRPRAAVPAASRVVGRGTTSPALQVRHRRGRWTYFTGVDDKSAGILTRLLEDLAAWARSDERQRMVADGWTPPPRKVSMYKPIKKAKKRPRRRR